MPPSITAARPPTLDAAFRATAITRSLIGPEASIHTQSAAIPPDVLEVESRLWTGIGRAIAGNGVALNEPTTMTPDTSTLTNACQTQRTATPWIYSGFGIIS